jgi:transcriptional regulator with XRE-family HTH domain
MQRHGKTVVQLGKEAGVDPSYLRRVTKGRPTHRPTQLSIDAGIKIASVLGEPVDSFAVAQAKRLVFERMQSTDASTSASSRRRRLQIRPEP